MPPFSGHILLVDDEPLAAQSIQMVLEFFGYSVITAHNGEDALLKFSREPFDLVITDYNMPGLQGDEVAQIIKNHKPKMPVILISGSPPAVLPVSVDRLLVKPFKAKALEETIIEFLAMKHQ